MTVEPGSSVTAEKYILLTTFRRNGDGVATPVLMGIPAAIKKLFGKADEAVGVILQFEDE